MQSCSQLPACSPQPAHATTCARHVTHAGGRAAAAIYYQAPPKRATHAAAVASTSLRQSSQPREPVKPPELRMAVRADHQNPAPTHGPDSATVTGGPKSTKPPGEDSPGVHTAYAREVPAPPPPQPLAPQPTAAHIAPQRRPIAPQLLLRRQCRFAADALSFEAPQPQDCKRLQASSISAPARRPPNLSQLYQALLI